MLVNIPAPWSIWECCLSNAEILHQVFFGLGCSQHSCSLGYFAPGGCCLLASKEEPVTQVRLLDLEWWQVSIPSITTHWLGCLTKLSQPIWIGSTTSIYFKHLQSKKLDPKFHHVQCHSRLRLSNPYQTILTPH